MYILWLMMTAIAALEVPRLLPKEKRGELVVFGVLWLIATIYASLVVGGVNLPVPSELLINLFGGEQ